MKTSRFLVALLLVSANWVHADDEIFTHPTTGKVLLESVLAEPSKVLGKSQVLQARFTQKKYLSEIPQPLTANGSFVFLRDVGVYWHTERPFDSVFVLTQQGILQRDEGTETLRISADAQPAVRVIANIFFALFTLDVSALSGNFDLYAEKQGGEKQGTKWLVGLKPKSTAIAGVFKQATVSGSASVEQVVFTDKRGDRTVIEMSELTTSSDVSLATRALFKR